jgi:hypothetical protein
LGLEELRRIIAESDRGDWNIISCFGQPSFLPWSPDGEFNEHHARASYRPDLSIGLAWGVRVNENFQEVWTQKFSDKKAHSCLADLFYNGMLVDREYYVVVDGGRACLPLPSDREKLIVSRWNYDFVKLLDEFGYYSGVSGGIGDRSPSEFNRYFQQAGFTVAD